MDSGELALIVVGVVTAGISGLGLYLTWRRGKARNEPPAITSNPLPNITQQVVVVPPVLSIPRGLSEESPSRDGWKLDYVDHPLPPQPLRRSGREPVPIPGPSSPMEKPILSRLSRTNDWWIGPKDAPTGASSKPELEAGPPHPRKKRTRKPEWQELYRRKMRVPSAGYAWIPFDLPAGAAVIGMASETDDFPFTLVVLDESNYTLYRQGARYNAEFLDREVCASRVSFTAVKSDRYFLVVETKRKQYDRDVQIDLRVKYPEEAEDT